MLKQAERRNTYYDILKIDPSATDLEIREAYLALAKIYHPDTNPGNKKIAALRFRLINEAYAAIKNETNRQHYNRLMASNVAAKPRGFHLQADNDNKSSDKPSGLLESLFSFLKSTTKSVEPLTVGSVSQPKER